MQNSAETTSDTALKRFPNSKRSKMYEMKNKMKFIMTKMQELEDEKHNDLEEFKKLMGEGDELQQLTASKVETCERMKESSLIRASGVQQLSHSQIITNTNAREFRTHSLPKQSFQPKPAENSPKVVPKKQQRRDQSSKIKMVKEVEL
jgi:hypothetical protein